jgi:hypothetical protein
MVKRIIFAAITAERSFWPHPPMLSLRPNLEADGALAAGQIAVEPILQTRCQLKRNYEHSTNKNRGKL